MSFCYDIKNEIGSIKPNPCCKLPLTYGFLLFSRAFSPEKISMQTENETAAKLYAKLLKECYNAETIIEVGGKRKPTYRAFVPDFSDRLKILASVDFGIAEGKINYDCFERECCEACFIRGAFLACGQIVDPEKGYRADFSVRDKSLAEELQAFLDKNFVKANVAKRGNGFTVYIKQREMIINLLTLMGASSRSLDLIETTMMRDVKNNTNRARNCDSANIRKAVSASVRQRKAIEYLIKKDVFYSLPKELVSAGELRLKYPIEPLSELCKNTDEDISVSGLNHRFKRIEDIYLKLSKGK
ncbi:MAG: DNA-binding protein WhiA [Clostridia bacterium]|nr:DNA-binding protein WhiA [Clostridia bacterium]